jgi:hypothetical protein
MQRPQLRLLPVDSLSLANQAMPLLALDKVEALFQALANQPLQVGPLVERKVLPPHLALCLVEELPNLHQHQGTCGHRENEMLTYIRET